MAILSKLQIKRSPETTAWTQADNAATVTKLLQEWKKLHPNSSLSPATIQEIIKLSSETKTFL